MHEMPKMTTSLIAEKALELDREVKYLLNKAKIAQAEREREKRKKEAEEKLAKDEEKKTKKDNKKKENSSSTIDDQESEIEVEQEEADRGKGKKLISKIFHSLSLRRTAHFPKTRKTSVSSSCRQHRPQRTHHFRL